VLTNNEGSHKAEGYRGNKLLQSYIEVTSRGRRLPGKESTVQETQIEIFEFGTVPHSGIRINLSLALAKKDYAENLKCPQ